MAQSHNLTILSQAITSGAAPVSVVNLSWTAIAPVNVLAGQALSGSGFTLNVDSAPSTFPTPGSLAVNSTDEFGNGLQSIVTYTGTSGSSFTGCNGGSGTTVASPAVPVLAATVQIDRTGPGSKPWLNTLTSSSQLTMTVESSADGGTTWQTEVSTTDVGGLITTPQGVTETEFTVNVGPINPSANAARVSCNASGPSSVQIAGQITVTSQ